MPTMNLVESQMSKQIHIVHRTPDYLPLPIAHSLFMRRRRWRITKIQTNYPHLGGILETVRTQRHRHSAILLSSFFPEQGEPPFAFLASSLRPSYGWFCSGCHNFLSRQSQYTFRCVLPRRDGVPKWNASQ